MRCPIFRGVLYKVFHCTVIFIVIIIACVCDIIIIRWLKRIPMLQSSEESAWLFHEIGRAYWDIGKYEDAIEFGKKSLDSAHDTKDHYWQLNANMLIAQSEG